MKRSICAAALAGTVLAALPAFAQSAPPEAIKEFTPTGTLRAAINYGNGVLAQKGPEGPRGISAALAGGLARRPGVPLNLGPVESRRKCVRDRQGQGRRRAGRRDRAGACRRCGLFAALCADRGHLYG